MNETTVQVTKVCRKCGEEKPATAELFYRDGKRPDGLQMWCRSCSSAYGKSHYRASHRPVPGHRERFWANVAIGAPDECWPWRRAKPGKYGFFQADRRCTHAHRYAWIFTHSDIDTGICVCHKCDNPPCCNPNHLFLGSHAENAADKVAKGRQSRATTHGRARLTTSQVREIRAMYRAGQLPRLIAQALGLNLSTVACVAYGRTWRSLSG